MIARITPAWFAGSIPLAQSIRTAGAVPQTYTHNLEPEAQGRPHTLVLVTSPPVGRGAKAPIDYLGYHAGCHAQPLVRSLDCSEIYSGFARGASARHPPRPQVCGLVAWKQAPTTHTFNGDDANES